MVELNNTKCCLIHNLHVEKRWDSERFVKMFF